MNWKQRFSDLVADAMRTAIRAALTFCGICLSFGLAYLCARFTLRFVEWCDHKFLSAPW